MLISKAAREADYGANPAAQKIDNPENATFQIAQNCMFQLLFYQKKMT